MANLLSISVGTSGLIGMLKRVGPAVDFVTMPVARETATRIVAEMQARLARQTHGTGATAAGIHFELMRDGNGYVVLMGDAVSPKETVRREATANTRAGRLRAKSTLYQEKHTGIWLEFGLPFRAPNTFWFASAALEEGPHMRRLVAAVQSALDELGR